MSVRVCRPKLVLKNLCLSLVAGVPPLLFRTTPLSVSLLVTTVSLAKTDEPIKIVPFGGEWGGRLAGAQETNYPCIRRVHIDAINASYNNKVYLFRLYYNKHFFSCEHIDTVHVDKPEYKL